jgi:hypothetical protein
MYVFEFVGMRTASRGRVQRGVVRGVLCLNASGVACRRLPSTPTECRACVNDWMRVGASVTVGVFLAALVTGAPRSRSGCVFIYYINSEERDQEPHRQSSEFMYLRGALLSSARSDCEV